MPYIFRTGLGRERACMWLALELAEPVCIIFRVLLAPTHVICTYVNPYVPPGLTQNSRFCPHGVFIYPGMILAINSQYFSVHNSSVDICNGSSLCVRYELNVLHPMQINCSRQRVVQYSVRFSQRFVGI
jgi:hypothetical protein